MYSNNPLFVACVMGDLEAVKIICNCNPHTRSSRHAGRLLKGEGLKYTAISDNYVETMAKYGNCPNSEKAQVLLVLPMEKWTTLEAACCSGALEVVKYMLTVHEYSKSNLFYALVAACASGQLEVIKYLIIYIKYLFPHCSESVLDCFLFTSCLQGHPDIVKFLIDECGCDPHCAGDGGLTPLHATCMEKKCLCSKIMEDVNSINMHGMLSNIWQAIGNPFITFLNALLYASTVSVASSPDVSHTPRRGRSHSEFISHKWNIFKYLVVEQKCKPQCKDKNGQTPLHYACASGQLKIVQYLYKEKLCDLVHTTLSGDTPLHIACKFSQVEITEFLLSTGECDPLCKNAEGMTPIEKATSVKIRELLDHFCNGNYPLESVVKVFVLGDPLAGKSSLVQALQSNPGFIGSLIGRLQRIKEERQPTAGINSHSFSSNDFGNVVIYDFAGQREFLTSHAAFLQNSSSQLAGIFIVVTNIAQCENDICHSLQYWVSFILECCAHSVMKPHIIFVGSHADQLNRGNIDQAYTCVEKTVFHKHDSNQFYKPKGIATMDCTRIVSTGLDLLRYYLEESCNSIRKRAGKIDQRCYVLHRYVWNSYTTANVQGCTLESISKDLEDNSHLLPSNPTELLPLFQTLHHKGQVLLLRNNQSLVKCWVITDIAAVLETVIGNIFAPYDFPTHISLGSTGIAARSRIREFFPDLDTDMIIGFLEHFEFCHQVKQSWINLSELEQTPSENTDDEFYLFPALVTSERPLHESQKCSYHCGWLMHSSVERQFLTTRFLHVLLLRIAFLFSQPQDYTTLSSTKAEGPAVRRKCKIWKNGITWHDANGV